MRGLIVVSILLFGFAAFANTNSRSDQMVEEAKVFIEQGNLSMANSLITLALLEDKKNQKAKKLRSKIEKLKKNNKS